MLLYFYLLNAGFFQARMRPALAESWRRRSFLPCRDLCADVLARTSHKPTDDSVLRKVATGLSFERSFLQALVGELLVFACDDMPLIQTAPDTLCCLLAPEQYGREVPRPAFAPIQQLHYGSRDLRFGGAFYRPDAAGVNDENDIQRLLPFMDAIDPATWNESLLLSMAQYATADERDEELAFVRDWWPALVETYRIAQQRGCVVICECV